VLTDHATLPSEADLPPDIVALSRCQYRHLRRREPTSDLARIVADLANIDPKLDSTTHGKQADETSWQAHWLPRARGSEPQSDTGAWHFTGRVAARQRVCDWLADPSQPALVVTGGPGTGKSALLAHLLVSSDAAWVDTVPTAGPRPPVGAFDLAIHVSGLSCEDVVQRVAHAVGLDVTRPPELLAAIRQRRQTGRPPVVIVADAVEEAATIDEARDIAVLLRNLAGTGAVRVVAGVRTAPTGTQRARILDAFGASIPRLSLESREFQRNEDVADYVRHRLIDDDTRGHYRNRTSAVLRKICWAVARKAGYNFLIAQLTTLWLTQVTTPPLDLTHPGWESRLPETVGEAMEEYLRHCGADPDLVRRILTALAFSRGNGLPYGRTWLTISDTLHPAHTHRPLELQTVFDSAAHYLLERTDDRHDEPTYRLYHHALDEHLRDYCTRYTPLRHPFRAITRGLIQATPKSEHGRRDWAAADDYTRTHLAGHAAQADLLDDVLTDYGFLVHAEPGPLLSALPHTRTEQGQVAAAVYRLSEHIHRHIQPVNRCRILALDAARFGAHDLRDHLNTVQDSLLGSDRFAWRARFATASTLPTATIATLTGHSDDVHAVAVAELDGRPIAVTGSGDGTVRLWDLPEQRQVTILTGHTGGVTAVAVAELDGRPIAVTSGYDKTVRLWDLAEQCQIGILTGHTGKVDAVAVAELDGRPTAVTSSRDWARNDSTVQLWDLAEQREIGILTGHTGNVSAVAVALLDDRPIAVTSGEDKTVRVWSIVDQSQIGILTILTGHAGDFGQVTAVAVAELDGRPIAVTGSYDGTMRLWDLAEQREITVLTGHAGKVSAVAVTELDGRPIAVTTGYDRENGAVRLWDLAEQREITVLTGHAGWVSAVAVTELDGRPIAVTGGSWDKTVRLWDLAEQRTLATPVTGHTATVTDVAVADLDGRPIAVTGSGDYTLRLWDLAEQREIAILTGHSAAVTEVAVTELDGRPTAVTSCMDALVRVWDLAERRQIAWLTGHAGGVDAVAVTELDGRPTAVTSGVDKTVRVWDLVERRQIAKLTGHTDRVTGVAVVHLDGRPVAVSRSEDETVRLWDLVEHHEIDILTGHTGKVSAVAVAQLDGRPVAVTGGEDESVRLWDLAERREIAILTGHTATVTEVAVTELDSQPVAVTGSYDGRVRTWDLRNQCCLDELVVLGRVNSMAFWTRGMLIVSYDVDIAAFEPSAPLNQNRD
jgi:WD40 repeat protein